MYKLILFDLGNVVIDISFDRIFTYWAALYQQNPDILRTRFRFGQVHADYESGRLTVEQFAQIVAQKLQLPLTQNEFEAGWSDIFLGINPTIVPILQHLRQKHIVAALSNTDPIHRRAFWQLYPNEMSLFERIFSSDEIGIRKPAPEAYQIVLQHYGILPQQTVFLDDKAENVAAAEHLGMKAIWVKDFGDIPVGLQHLNLLLT
ncbi:MAG: HAD-IA family hydrolase [Chitinophagales bacterium]|nr:HAD-IA family hydrolase [Chitinophagales bacterium]